MNVSTTSNVGDLTPYVEDEFEDLKENPSQGGKIDAYRSPNQLIATPSYILNSKPLFFGNDGHCSSTSLDFDLASHHPYNV